MVWSELGSAAAEAAVITAMPSAMMYSGKGDKDPREEVEDIVKFMLPAGGAAMAALARYHKGDAKKPKGALGRAATEGAIGGAAFGLTLLAGRKLYRPWSKFPWKAALGLGASTAVIGTCGFYVAHLAVDAARARQ